MKTRRAQHPASTAQRKALLALLVAVCALSVSGAALGQEKPVTRPGRLEWTETKQELVAGVEFHDVVDENIRKKLSRGLPTTIVFTATLYRVGADQPISASVQSCKITWHVWNEMYHIELTRPEGTRTRWTPTIQGVLRRCAQVEDLLVAGRAQVAPGSSVFLEVKVQVNPISPDVLNKIKRWVSRPARTGTAAPGDALFSTFTGLFMQRIKDAERTLEFRTPPAVPRVRPPAPRPPAGGRREG